MFGVKTCLNWKYSVVCGKGKLAVLACLIKWRCVCQGKGKGWHKLIFWMKRLVNQSVVWMKDWLDLRLIFIGCECVCVCVCVCVFVVVFFEWDKLSCTKHATECVDSDFNNVSGLPHVHKWVRDRERERDRHGRQTQRQRERDRKRESECVCVCDCVCLSTNECKCAWLLYLNSHV